MQIFPCALTILLGLCDKMKVLMSASFYVALLCFVFSLLKLPGFVKAAPSGSSVNNLETGDWTSMKNYDIWSAAGDGSDSNADDNQTDFDFISVNDLNSNRREPSQERQSKVLHLFPVPVDGECLSDDGRRTGTCFNAYECRLKGGISKGECAMGFGVCCIFIASCNQTISNNITYLVSPNFPSFMPSNFTSCKVKVKMMNQDISQLRVDFYHFSLGQPNRRTGICDGDIFNVSGGPGGPMALCGQNSGQHIYYDVGGRNTARQTLYGSLRPLTYSMLYPNRNNSANGSTSSNSEPEIEIAMNFAARFLTTRFWEIRISQIPFSQRAPAGCLQYFTGMEGVVQTFNFADNGRHLANQHYRVCMRQEMNMCSINYEPCDEQSFRIGASIPPAEVPDPTTAASVTADAAIASSVPASSTVQSDTLAADTAAPNDETNDEIEGSGGEEPVTPASLRRPVRGGFDILSFFRSAFDFRRRRQLEPQFGFSSEQRQFFTTCTDRITMPCIIEDFIGAGLGPLPGCEPVHCGNQFCMSGTSPCRIESTVTPFYMGIHFGDGQRKGSPEDNIGACIRFTQMQCM